MKKLISLLCAAALALSLAGCGTSAASGGETAAASTTYSLENATVLTFTDGGVTAQDGSDTGYEIDGTEVTITGAGTYAVTHLRRRLHHREKGNHRRDPGPQRPESDQRRHRPYYLQ